MNVVVWARVSSREQKEGYSIDAQLRAMRDRAKDFDWRIAREFEVAESAKRGAERIAFNQMLAWVRANAKREKITAILSHKLDRVCRNMRDAVRLQDLEDTCGGASGVCRQPVRARSGRHLVFQRDGRRRPVLQRQFAVRSA